MNRIQEELFRHQDGKYREFQSRLVPTVDPETIIGVRTPAMRKIAKEVHGSLEEEAFLNDLPHSYYEENLVHFFLIAMIRNFDECTEAVERFLPYVDCWPVCDQSSPKAFAKNHEKLLPLIRKWMASDHIYTVRFGIRMLMNEFLGEDFKPEYPGWVAAVCSEEYYVNMMIAWYFATALAKQYEATLPYLENNALDVWCHNKSIQKALESYRITPEQKEYLKTLKRKDAA